MALKRAALLLFGLAGSVLISAVLYTSAGSIVGVPPSAVTEPPQNDVTMQYGLTLPMMVPNTTLVIEVLTAYEGPFLEDGTDREVVDIAALQVCNVGDKEILQAYIELQLDDCFYIFRGEHIPPGIPVLLLECNAQHYRHAVITACNGWQVASTETVLKKPKVAIQDRPLGTLVVTNLTEETLLDVRLYYKSWLSPPGICVGGIAYTVCIPVLKPGQTQYLYPHHFASGFSKVVCITTE